MGLLHKDDQHQKYCEATNPELERVIEPVAVSQLFYHIEQWLYLGEHADELLHVLRVLPTIVVGSQDADVDFSGLPETALLPYLDSYQRYFYVPENQKFLIHRALQLLPNHLQILFHRALCCVLPQRHQQQIDVAVVDPQPSCIRPIQFYGKT